MLPEGEIVRFHVWLDGGVTVGMRRSGAFGVGHGIGGIIGICTLGSGGVIGTLRGGGAVGTLGGGGAVGTLGSGGAWRPDCLVVVGIVGMLVWTGRVNFIISAN